MAPVVAKEAKLLKSAMKGMNIGEKKKITMADSSEDSAGEEVNPDIFNKPISKKRGLQRQMYKTMKKEMRRKLKTHCSGSKKRAKELEAAQEETKRRFAKLATRGKEDAMEM